MASSSPFPGMPADPFTSFWSDFMAKLGQNAAPPPTPSQEAMNQMRRAFFDAMAQHADQFMRSEAFATAIRQSMDHALGWQQMVNQTLQKTLSAAQMPSRADADHLTMLVRGVEDRLMARLDDVSKRIKQLENGKADGKPARGAAEKKPSRRRG